MQDDDLLHMLSLVQTDGMFRLTISSPYQRSELNFLSPKPSHHPDTNPHDSCQKLPRSYSIYIDQPIRISPLHRSYPLLHQTTIHYLI